MLMKKVWRSVAVAAMAGSVFGVAGATSVDAGFPGDPGVPGDPGFPGGGGGMSGNSAPAPPSNVTCPGGFGVSFFGSGSESFTVDTTGYNSVFNAEIDVTLGTSTSVDLSFSSVTALTYGMDGDSTVTFRKDFDDSDGVFSFASTTRDFTENGTADALTFAPNSTTGAATYNVTLFGAEDPGSPGSTVGSSTTGAFTVPANGVVYIPFSQMTAVIGSGVDFDAVSGYQIEISGDAISGRRVAVGGSTSVETDLQVRSDNTFIGSFVSMTAQVTNRSNAAIPVRLESVLLDGPLNVGSVTTTAGSVVTGNTDGDTTVVVDLGSVPPGATEVVRFSMGSSESTVYDSPQGGDMITRAWVQAGQPPLLVGSNSTSGFISSCMVSFTRLFEAPFDEPFDDDPIDDDPVPDTTVAPTTTVVDANAGTTAPPNTVDNAGGSGAPTTTIAGAGAPGAGVPTTQQPVTELPATGSPSAAMAWIAALLLGVGLMTFGAARRRI
ncbi:MAG: hypothetical protein AB8G14_16250 [Ilumatobacter sp.]